MLIYCAQARIKCGKIVGKWAIKRNRKLSKQFVQLYRLEAGVPYILYCLVYIHIYQLSVVMQMTN